MSPRTGLHANPFCVLGVTTRDDGRKIIEMAEERSLSIDPDDCQKARSALTNPRTRLAAEIAWMPGVPPRTVESLVSALSENPASVRRGPGLPDLARANVMAAALELLEEGEPVASVAQLICDLARVVESVVTANVLRDINEDRAISGFPEVQTIDAVEDALAERRKAHLSVLRNVLDRMETEKLIETMSIAVSLATSHGDEHGPALLDDLVDTYEGEAQVFLQPEQENIVELVRRSKAAAPRGVMALIPFLDRLDRVVKNWDRVAQPIQISAKSRGMTHHQSREIALALRNLGVDLVNEHRMLDEASRIIKLVQETFSELPEVAERLEGDVRTISELRAERDEWAREISFRAEVGVFAKEELAISPDGIRWNSRTFPLDEITRVRWGGVRHSVNGIPTGTNYTIAFGDKSSQQVIELRKEATFNGFIDALWRAVCVRLMIEMLRDLSKGESFLCGDVKVEDAVVTLAKHKFFGARESVRVSWSEVNIWSADGRLYIGKANDKNTYGSMSYIDSWNVHILENLIRGSFKKGGQKLSDFLRK
jgi:hypothetical protein